MTSVLDRGRDTQTDDHVSALRPEARRRTQEAGMDSTKEARAEIQDGGGESGGSEEHVPRRPKLC